MDISRTRSAKFFLSALADRIFPNCMAWFSTIRARLYCAFGFAAMLTMAGSLTALYEFTNIGTMTSEILSRSIPATVVSLRLAEQSANLVSSAPQLMAAPDDKTRVEAINGIYRRAHGLEEGIAHLRKLNIEPANDIELIYNTLVQRLGMLNEAVAGRIAISVERNQLALSIRTEHEALLDGLAPAVDDANFELMTRSNNSALDPSLSLALESLRRLLETQSESNLLAGLLTEASLVSESSPTGTAA